ncbi:hypothetical protein FBS47_08925 [Neisseria gonorrhoeae]
MTFFLLRVRIVFLFSFLIFEEIMNTRINFTATVGKRVSQCYVTSVISTIGVTTSDAICSGGGTNKAKSQCNALLKAAGHC